MDNAAGGLANSHSLLPILIFVALVIVGAGVKTRRDTSGRLGALDVTQNPAAGVKPCCCTVYGREWSQINMMNLSAGYFRRG